MKAAPRPASAHPPPRRRTSRLQDAAALAAVSAATSPATADAASATAPVADTVAGLLIRPMERRDLREVRRIDRLVYPRPWSMALYLDELARSGERVYRVACQSGPAARPPRVVGYGGFMIVVGEGHITSVAVHPECQGRRVGARLLLALHRAARSIDELHALTLEVRASNAAAQRLYRWFGYAPVGTRRNYYRDGPGGKREDALVMWCHDIDSPAHGERLDAIATDLGIAELASGTAVRAADSASDTALVAAESARGASSHAQKMEQTP